MGISDLCYLHIGCTTNFGPNIFLRNVAYICRPGICGFFTWLHIDWKKSKYKSFKPISAILGKSIIRYIYVQNDVFYGFYMCMKRAFWKQLNVSFVTVTVAHRGQLQTINDCCKQLKVAANNSDCKLCKFVHLPATYSINFTFQNVPKF